MTFAPSAASARATSSPIPARGARNQGGLASQHRSPPRCLVRRPAQGGRECFASAWGTSMPVQPPDVIRRARMRGAGLVRVAPEAVRRGQDHDRLAALVGGGVPPEGEVGAGPGCHDVEDTLRARAGLRRRNGAARPRGGWWLRVCGRGVARVLREDATAPGGIARDARGRGRSPAGVGASSPVASSRARDELIGAEARPGGPAGAVSRRGRGACASGPASGSCRGGAPRPRPSRRGRRGGA